jgi:hypothetical protein
MEKHLFFFSINNTFATVSRYNRKEFRQMKVKFWYIVFIVCTTISFLGLIAPGIISKAASVSEKMNFEQLNTTHSSTGINQDKESSLDSIDIQSDSSGTEKADNQTKFGSFEHMY